MSERRIYPLDGDPDLLHVCWSKFQLSKNRHAITHIVSQDNQRRTLCGIDIYNAQLRNEYAGWDFEIWSVKDDGWGVSSVGCMKCKKSLKLQNI